MAILLTGCEEGGHSHDSSGHGHGHGDHGGGHAHGDGHGGSDRSTHVVTRVGEHTELFVEFPALVAGRGSEFAAHFTQHGDYQPVRRGELSVVLTGDDAPGERWETEEPARPGIFAPTATPRYPGKRRLFLVLKTDAFTERFDLGELDVFESKEAAREVEVENPEGDISFLKEQQWKVDFDVEPGTREKLRPSVRVNATIRPASDRSQLWLEAHVPEADLARIDDPTGAWFQPATDGPPIEVNVGEGGELISFGEVIDPKTRTVPLIYALGDDAPVHRLRVGAFVQAHILSGEPEEVVAIPTSAVLDEKGLYVVFVMKGGESFERRTVRLGMRDRGMVEVVDGLEPGERVVSRGAYYVKLAGTATGSVGHGHAH